MHPVERRTRPDRPMAELVDDGIAMLDSGHRAVAAELLYAAGVPFRVIVRVLAEPGHRRMPIR